MEAKSEASENEAKKCQIFEKGRFFVTKSGQKRIPIQYSHPTDNFDNIESTT